MDANASAIEGLKSRGTIPVFPLPDLVFFPHAGLPLHIFEPRYRALVRDSLESHRIIGMVQLVPGYEQDYLKSPPVRDVGCAGMIAQANELADGRFLIWLVGVEKFQIAREVTAETIYRQVEIRHEGLVQRPGEQAGVQALRGELLAALPRFVKTGTSDDKELNERLLKLDDSQLVAVSTQILGLAGDGKQKVLEAASVLERYLLLHDHLQQRFKDSPAAMKLRPEDVN